MADMIRSAALPLAVAVAVLGGAAPASAAHNHRPVGRADRGTTNEAALIRLDVLSNDRDPDGDRLRITDVRVAGTKGRVTVGRKRRVIVYDPAGAFDALDRGETAVDRFSYRISDRPGRRDSARASVSSQLVRVAVTVTGVGYIPPLYDYQLYVGANTGGNYFDVLNGAIYPGNLTITSVTQPPRGKAYLDGGTILGYDAPLGYCNTNNGNPTDDFTYTMTDGTSTATGKVLASIDCS
jgi:hypothetical protein